MAVMTSQLMDKPAFEAKAPPVSSADLMALDSDINGHSHDALFEESHTSDTVAQPPPTMNGDHHALEPEEIEPVTHVTSGIAPTVPFKPETEPVANTSLLLDIPEPPVAPISLPPAIEAPLSDLRQDITAEQTESLPVQEESAPAVDATQSTVATEPDASQDDSTAPATQDNTMGTTISAPDDDTQPAPPAAELPEPSSSDAPPASEVEPTKAEPAEADQEMTDAPPSGKIRAREEDEGEGDLEPSAKRTKVEEEELAADTGVAEASETAQPPGGEAAAPGLLTKASSSDPLWPTFDAEPITPQQQSTLLQRIRNARKIKAAGPFNKPVDWVALNIPNYPEVVKEPMDLGTVENKLKASQYPTVDAFLYDLNLMVRNCYTFNGREHPVSHLAADLERYVTAIFPAALDRNGQGGTEAKKPKKPIIVTERKETRRKSMATQQATAQQAAAAAAPPTPVAAPAPPTPATAAPPAAPAAAAAAPAAEAKSPVASVTSPSDRFALQPDGTPTIRRDSTTQDGRPKRQIQKPKPKDLPYSVKPKKKKFELELKFCEQILNEVRKKQHSRFVYAFLYPVDPVALNIPHYHKVIKKPMDIQTIDQKLHRGEYATSKEFKSDFDLMLANCFKFNPETDEVHQMGKQVKELFNGLWAGKDAWMEEHQPQSEAHSASADEDDDEEEESSDEDEEDSQQRDLVAIQQQIAELTSRAQTIIQSGMKRVSPKVKGEKKKGKGGAKASGEKKKKGAGGSSGAGAKVAALKTKKTKVVPLTFAQKQEISETISTLDEPNMRKAVQIIRNGVPSLRGVNDEELEIDMDLIPDEVLRELYKFLRGTRPKAAGSAMDVSDDEFEMPKHHRAPKGSGSGSGGGGGGGAKRKNKPMGKKEQEESIRQIQRQLESFKNPGADGDELMGSPPLGGGRDETSSDDDGESESEEE